MSNSESSPASTARARTLAPSRVMSVVRALAGETAGLSLSELSTRTGIPVSSLVNLLRPLVDDGYVDNRNKVYALGSEIFSICSLVMSTNQFPANVHHVLTELRDNSKETCLLAVPDRSWQTLVYVDIVESQNSLRFSPERGQRREMYKAAAGKVLLAFSGNDHLATFFEHFDRLSDRESGFPHRKQFEQELAEVRTLGYAFSSSSIPGVSAIMAPVKNAAGHAVAALGLAGPSDRVRAHTGTYVEAILGAAREASAVLAHSAV